MWAGCGLALAGTLLIAADGAEGAAGGVAEGLLVGEWGVSRVCLDAGFVRAAALAGSGPCLLPWEDGREDDPCLLALGTAVSGAETGRGKRGQ